MTTETKKQIIEAITKRMASPKQYSLDGESITMDTPEDLAKLIQLLQQAEDAGTAPKRTPFRVAVCTPNSPII